MKKNTQQIALTILLNIIVCTSIAQTKSLTVGDLVPNVKISNIVNYKSSQAYISDFKNKLLILDFWATWCAPCVSMLPVCDSLQKEFNDDVQILPVAEQDRTTVTTFINHIQSARHISFPSVTGDTVLSKMFVHTEIPHYVWIDRTGKVIAITGADKLTSTTIKDYLNSGIITVAIKEDNFKQINEHQPMFKVANELIDSNNKHIDMIPDNNVLYHSVITGYIDGFGCESGADNERILCKNYSIGGLYRVALGGTDIKKMFVNSTVWQVHNTAVLAYTDSADMQLTSEPEIKQWLKTHTFCYELKCANTSFEKRSSIMLRDLNNYFGTTFGISGDIETVPAKILALVKTNSNTSFATKGISEKSIVNTYYLKIKNQPVSALLNFLSFQMDWLPPLKDETEYKSNIDIELSCDLTNLQDVNKALSAYGLQLEEKEEPREMIVIKDKQ